MIAMVAMIVTIMMMVMTMILMMMLCFRRESIEKVYEENSYLGERTREYIVMILMAMKQSCKTVPTVPTSWCYFFLAGANFWEKHAKNCAIMSMAHITYTIAH